MPPELVLRAAYRCGHTIGPNFSVSIVVRSRHQGLGFRLGEFSSTALKLLEEKPMGRSRARDISERPCFSSPTLLLSKQTMFPAIAMISQGLSKRRFPSLSKLMVGISCLRVYFRVLPISPQKNPKRVNFCTGSLSSSRLVLRIDPCVAGGLVFVPFLRPCRMTSIKAGCWKTTERSGLHGTPAPRQCRSARHAQDKAYLSSSSSRYPLWSLSMNRKTSFT